MAQGSVRRTERRTPAPVLSGDAYNSLLQSFKTPIQMEQPQPNAKPQAAAPTGNAVMAQLRQDVQSAPTPQVERSEAPPLGTSLSQPARPDEGGISGFLNDPKTIAATIFGLAALNSESDNIAGAFLEGLGAVGSAFEAQHGRSQQEYENRLAERSVGVQERGLDIQEFQAEQAAKAQEQQTAFGLADAEYKRLQLNLQSRGLDLQQLEQGRLERYQKASIALGEQTNKGRLLAALIAADVARERTGAMTSAQNDALKIALLKLAVPEDIYGVLTEEQKKQHTVNVLRAVKEHFPFADGLIKDFEKEIPVPGLGGAPNKAAAKASLGEGETRAGIAFAAKQLGLAEDEPAVPGVVKWNDPELQNLVENAKPEELQAALADLQSRVPGMEYVPGPGWIVTEPQQGQSGLVAGLRERLGGPAAAQAEGQIDLRAAKAVAQGIKPGQRFLGSDDKVYELSADGKSVTETNPK